MSKYYLNKINILKLIRKLTNQMVTYCKIFINSKTQNTRKFWDFMPIEYLIDVFKEWINLNST